MFIDKFKKAISNQFLRNIGWLGIAELINRVFRLGATVTLARVFNPEDYGLMAIVYTTFEFATLLPFQSGIGSKLVQADEKDIEELCTTAYWMHWFTCGSAFLLQCLGAVVYTLISGDSRLLLPLCLAALAYLIFPLCMINHSLIKRDNRMSVNAACNALQAVIANVTIVVFALMGMGVWAIVWSILLSTPVWWILGWRNHPWRPPQHFTLDRWQELFEFGKNILGVELLTKLRMNIDYLIVGHFLGVKALGMYYFAFSAGSGITLNIVYSITGAIFPHLCSARGDLKLLKKRYLSSLKTIAFTIVPIIVLQVCLAHLYIPIIFGEKWNSTVSIVILICSSVIPFAFSMASSLLLNAIDKTHITLRLDFIFTIVFALSLLIAVHWNIYWVAVAVALANWLILPASSIWVTRHAFVKQ